MEARKLTKEEEETIKILIRLGDSPDLALATVLKQKEKNSELYYAAYCL